MKLELPFGLASTPTVAVIHAYQSLDANLTQSLLLVRIWKWTSLLGAYFVRLVYSSKAYTMLTFIYQLSSSNELVCYPS